MYSGVRQLEQSLTNEASAPPLTNLWCEQSDMKSGKQNSQLKTIINSLKEYCYNNYSQLSPSILNQKSIMLAKISMVTITHT